MRETVGECDRIVRRLSTALLQSSGGSCCLQPNDRTVVPWRRKQQIHPNFGARLWSRISSAVSSLDIPVISYWRQGVTKVACRSWRELPLCCDHQWPLSLSALSRWCSVVIAVWRTYGKCSRPETKTVRLATFLMVKRLNSYLQPAHAEKPPDGSSVSDPVQSETERACNTNALSWCRRQRRSHQNFF
jgi:hypothetical protein